MLISFYKISSFVYEFSPSLSSFYFFVYGFSFLFIISSEEILYFIIYIILLLSNHIYMEKYTNYTGSTDFKDLTLKYNEMVKNINILLQKDQLDNTNVKNIKTELLYFNNNIDKRVVIYDNNNEALVNKIKMLNEDINKKKQLYKKLKKNIQSNKNIESGLITSLSDTSQSYKSILTNILLKDIVVFSLFYYVYMYKK
jgi:hypothetical protein